MVKNRPKTRFLMDLKRKSEKLIREWLKNSPKKALLVKGARQVGKTHAIRRVLTAEHADFFEINLIETPAAVDVLAAAQTVDDLVLGFSALSTQKLEKGKTIIFIDEVQKYKEMITKIKFLVEEGSFRYVLSGSLLGVELTNLDSAPVGYMTTVEMFPLDFEEFLQITNIDDNIISSLRTSFENRMPVMDAVNQKMLDLFMRYLIVGGMLTSEYGMNTKSMLLTKNQNLNAGRIYENAIAQELYSKGFQLYYYNSNRLGELDFVIEYNNRALPIEVKSGKDYTIHSAMNNCLANSEYQMQEGFVFANCNVSRKGKVTYLPIYMVMFLQQDSEQIVLDKIEF